MYFFNKKGAEKSKQMKKNSTKHSVLKNIKSNRNETDKIFVNVKSSKTFFKKKKRITIFTPTRKKNRS